MKWKEFLKVKDNHNESIESYFSGLDAPEKVLISFVRHSGCTYCREMLSDLSAFKSAHQDLPFRILVVHMSSYTKGDEILKNHGLDDVRHISDPEAKIYKLFDLSRGTLSQLFGFKTLLRGFSGLAKHGIGLIDGDPAQMPGTFLVNKEGLEKSFIHKSVADRVNFEMFLDDNSKASLNLVNAQN